LRLTLANDGTTAVAYTLTVNDYAGCTQTVSVGEKGSKSVTLPVDADGYYDVIITANTSDGFTRRYRGPDRVNQRKSKSVSRTNSCFTWAGRLNAAGPAR